MRKTFSQSSSPDSEQRLSCDTVSRKVTIGPAFVLGDGHIHIPAADKVPEGDARTTELARFTAAVDTIKARYSERLAHLDKLPPEVQDCTRGMLQAELALLEDPSLARKIAEKTAGGDNAAHAVYDHLNNYITLLRANEFSRRSAEPLSSVLKEFLHELNPQDESATIADAPDGCIPVTPAMAVGMMSHFRSNDGATRIPAMINSSGTPKDHTNIIAGGAGIAVARVTPDQLAALETGDMLILDGETGNLIVNPDASTLARYEEETRHIRERDAALLRLSEAETGLPRTRDGTDVAVVANIALSEDVPVVNAMRADGIGLYRTEMALSFYETPPSAKFWELVFGTIVGNTEKGKVVIRTIDLAGDKENGNFNSPQKIQTVIDRQMAAAVSTAQKHGAERVGVMIPLIESAAHLRAHQDNMDAIAAKQGLPSVKLGAMVEVPSFIDDLDGADPAFLSIGTNDLITAILGLNRFDQADAGRYDPTDPAVLDAIGKTVAAGQAKDIPVSVCGDMASEPRYFPLLIGAGVRTLSAGPASVPLIKELVRRVDANDARALYETISKIPDRAERERLLDDFNRRHMGLENGMISLSRKPAATPSPGGPKPS